MKKRKLGNSGLEVSALGYGAMGLTAVYGAPPDQAAGIAILRRRRGARRHVLRHRRSYGPFTNEEIVGEGLGALSRQVVIATKFGFDLDPVTARTA